MISDLLLFSMGNCSAGFVASNSRLGVGKLSAGSGVDRDEEFVVHLGMIEVRLCFRCVRGNGDG